jgi:hypothetical protein
MESRSEKGKRRAMFLKKNAVQSKNNKCKKDENWVEKISGFPDTKPSGCE